MALCSVPVALNIPLFFDDVKLCRRRRVGEVLHELTD